MADDLGDRMSYSTPYLIPQEPPAEVLAELDAAGRALDGLMQRAAELTLGMDEEARSLRIELVDGSETRPLTPTQLFDLLRGS